LRKHLLKECRKGYTILEVLVAALITGILAAAAFEFYTTMHGQSETQYNVSEMQQLARSSMYDIRKTLLQAGFKLGATHPPYKISGDTLEVYYSISQPVDSVKYYLVEFTSGEYANVPDLPTGQKLYKLVKKENSGAAVVYADFLSDINFNQVDSANIIVTINVQAMRSDEDYSPNSGFRIYSVSERINVRNVG
jgi:prepilin-type N-terminal cleavage/methylation domain-containing protein